MLDPHDTIAHRERARLKFFKRHLAHPMRLDKLLTRSRHPSGKHEVDQLDIHVETATRKFWLHGFTHIHDRGLSRICPSTMAFVPNTNHGAMPQACV